MASIRPQIALTLVVLFGGTAAACPGGSSPDAGAEASGSATAERLSTVAPWRADANGPTLFEHVVDLARERAEAMWVPPQTGLAARVADLTYAQYRDIRFRSDQAIWRGAAPFEVQLFHPGGGNDTPVRIHLVEDGRSRLLPFDTALFSYGDLVDAADVDLEPRVGFPGFRVLHAMNDPDKMDEVVAFLGASYFRLVGPRQVYGLSSRGLAVDIAEPGGEEFPDFVEFWLVRPEPEARELAFYALLDGPSVTGAYRFELVPGTAEGVLADGAEAVEPPLDGGDASTGTVLAVQARLFARRDVRKLGIAPLTSMYLHGPLLPGGHDDFRPRVHDSEGLLMLTSRDEWIWRPLTNGSGVRVTSLRDVDPDGFGLVQRARAFDDYMDLEALYHRRPSYWVAIDGEWGSGGVELLEIPTTSEFNDNVVAYWVPDRPMEAGDELELRYRIVTFDDRLAGGAAHGGPLPTQTLARVVRTRIGWDALPGEADPPPRSVRRVVVDFEGRGLERLPPDAEPTAELSTSSGTISDLRVRPLPGGGRRATFALSPDGDRGADMRLFLRLGDTAITETWSYLWEPDLVR